MFSAAAAAADPVQGTEQHNTRDRTQCTALKIAAASSPLSHSHIQMEMHAPRTRGPTSSQGVLRLAGDSQQHARTCLIDRVTAAVQSVCLCGTDVLRKARCDGLS